MATEKLDLKELQRRKAESMTAIMRSMSDSFKQGTLRKVADPKPV